MDYKLVLARTILSILENIDMANKDYNITSLDYYNGELHGLINILNELELTLSNNSISSVELEGYTNCLNLIREVLGEGIV